MDDRDEITLLEMDKSVPLNADGLTGEAKQNVVYAK